MKKTTDSAGNGDPQRLRQRYRFWRKLILLLRNAFVLAATALFLISICNGHENYLLKVIGYLLGAVAYCLELVHLTRFFRKRIAHDEMFMVYCFAPLYILMGLSYLKHL